ncbi:MAG: DUF1343 domain-containing protein [Candidatus Methanomethylicia archaeon]|nr:DUF1343 domain-containing protein [Candidatus Methanomethylicia archaeon]
MGRVKIGLEVLIEEEYEDLKGKNIGIVANQSSITPEFTHVIDEVKKSGKCNVKRVFSPEHGFKIVDEILEYYHDDEYNVDIYSLHGLNYKPRKSHLEDLDVLIFDLQDVGARWYTYVSTLYYCLEACGEASVNIIVLDRPNPITGEIVEGPILESNYRSFVGIAEIPVRYGLTIGELAIYLNEKYNLKADLKVIAMNGWERSMWFNQTGLPWIQPSPNIPSSETTQIYIGTCLIEGTNLSEGRGTVKPFHFIGAPWIKSKILAEELNKTGLIGVGFRPLNFKPTSGKYKGRICGGIEIHITDVNTFRPFLTGLQIIHTIKKLYLDKFRWRKIKGKYWFDMLVGNNWIRKTIDEGGDPWSIVDEIEDKLVKYVYEKENYHIY